MCVCVCVCVPVHVRVPVRVSVSVKGACMSCMCPYRNWKPVVVYKMDCYSLLSLATVSAKYEYLSGSHP